MEILSKILQAVLEIVLPAAAVWMVARLSRQVTDAIEKLRNDRPDLYCFVRDMTSTVTMAAEQIFGSGKGTEKKKYAIGALENILNAQGITLDLQAIDALIEASVYDNFNRWKNSPILEPETKEAE